MDVLQQVANGALVCPVSRSPLSVEGGSLIAAGEDRRYRLLEGVPILLPDEGGAHDYLTEEGSAMANEYRQERGLVALRRRIDSWVIGGGPDRWGDHITNLNIDRFPNVDVVGDAYALPYADGSVDSVLCWAVIEHLEFPERAVAEMHRVLKPGGLALLATPFLQAFHAYPNHFQNLTIVGQDRMLERAGFVVESSGATGATFALIDLGSVYVRSFLPGRILPGVIARLLRLLAVATAPLDRRLAQHPNGHVVASNVFSLARRAELPPG